MIIDFSWSGGLVLGINHTDEVILKTGEDEFEFVNAIMLHLGFFTIAIIFVLGD
jgi:hypothetical protein